MSNLRPPRPALWLLAFGLLLGLGLLEAGARIAAVLDERRQGRLDRDLDRVANPAPGAVVTLGQIIRRSEDPRVVYELRPRLDVVFAGARMTTSDNGHRGPEVLAPKPEGTFRIVGIGDSYMFGQGVSDEETYLARLPALMPGRGIETVNLAVPGYNTTMEVEALRIRADRLDPDLVLIEIVGNDLDLPNFLWNSVDPWTADRSFLLSFVRTRLERIRPPPADAGGLAPAPLEGRAFSRDSGHVPARYASMVGPAAFEQALDRLAGFGRERRIPVLALTHGVWFEDAMMEALKRNGIPVLVLRSALRRAARALGAPDYPRSPLAHSPSDLHPSALGHAAIAGELGSWIEEQLPGPLGAGPGRRDAPSR